MNKNKIGYNKHLSLKYILYFVRFVSIILIIMSLLLTAVYAYRSVGVVKDIFNQSNVELFSNHRVINYVSQINNYTTNDISELFGSVNNPLVIAGIYVIMPTCLFFVALFFLIYSGVLLFDFTSGIKNQKDLLKEKKYELLHNTRVYIYLALGLLTIMYGIGYFFILIAVGVLFEFVLYLFDTFIESIKKGAKK